MAQQIIHTESGMLQGATIQYRNYFRTMAMGGRWCVFRAVPGETLSGVIVAPYDDMPKGVILVDHIETMTEERMRILLSNAIRYGAHPRTSDDTGDYGYLQHGAGTSSPFRTERVAIKNEYADKWLARFEGKWRRVHIQLKRTFIVYQGEKITIQIEGV